MSDDPDMNWQGAVAALARERTLAEGGVALLKAYGSPAAIANGFQKYTAAKAEYDAVISGLTVALTQSDDPDSLDTLEQHMADGFALRQDFSSAVNALLPPQPPAKGIGISDIIGDAVKGAVTPVLDAVKAIWFRHKDDDALRRASIQTQLSAAKWAEFSAIHSILG
jgi:hypothetical protein